ncbi:hypothetical protein [Nitrosomonas sp. Is37]|nr:hypothetical protein [Nitrosomonas sp. Is37]MDV6343095.1 hypothetical protein [Nitrosomonas sp. Is37]
MATYHKCTSLHYAMTDTFCLMTQLAASVGIHAVPFSQVFATDAAKQAAQ